MSDNQIQKTASDSLNALFTQYLRLVIRDEIENFLKNGDLSRMIRDEALKVVEAEMDFAKVKLIAETAAEQAVVEHEQDKSHQEIDEDELDRKIENAVEASIEEHTSTYDHDEFLSKDSSEEHINDHENNYDHEEYVTNDDLDRAIRDTLKEIAKDL